MTATLKPDPDSVLDALLSDSDPRVRLAAAKALKEAPKLAAREGAIIEVHVTYAGRDESDPGEITHIDTVVSFRNLSPEQQSAVTEQYGTQDPDALFHPPPEPSVTEHRGKPQVVSG